LPQYAGTLDPADAAVVFFDPHAVELKRLTPLDPAWVVKSFNRPGLTVARSRAELEHWLRAQIEPGTTLLAMSSGSWGGLDLKSLAV
jgi:UDP-N-acetylmuramate: L-alanyl-gamma-D-glutamyl-meso-diaminopimelate ligase